MASAERLPQRIEALFPHRHRSPAPRSIAITLAGSILNHFDTRNRIVRRLRCKVGRPIDARRKTIVESVFGQSKEARGLWQLLLRRREKVNSEWSLMYTAHNLLKLFRFWRSEAKLAAAAGECPAPVS